MDCFGLILLIQTKLSELSYQHSYYDKQFKVVFLFCYKSTPKFLCFLQLLLATGVSCFSSPRATLSLTINRLIEQYIWQESKGDSNSIPHWSMRYMYM